MCYLVHDSCKIAGLCHTTSANYLVFVLVYFNLSKSSLFCAVQCK